MHKIIITTYNPNAGGVAVTVLEFDSKITAKNMYAELLKNNKDFPLARTLEIFLASDMA